MAGFDTFLLVLAGIVSLGAIGFFFYTVIKGRNELDDNKDIVLNWQSYENEGRFIGPFMSQQSSPTGRELIKYRPVDVDVRPKKYSKQEIKDKIKPQVAIVDKKNLIIISRGYPSDDKSIIIIPPKTLSEIPENVRNSEFGLALAYAMQQRDAKNSIIDMMEDGRTEKNKILDMIGDGEFTAKRLEQLEEFMKDSLRVVVSDKESKTRTGSVNVDTNKFGGEKY